MKTEWEGILFFNCKILFCLKGQINERVGIMGCVHLKKKLITYLDLFAGAGGLSEGFASVGYQPIAHVEMDVNACNTLNSRVLLLSPNNRFKLQVYRLSPKVYYSRRII